MSITKRHHRRVVQSLSVVIALLVVAIGVLLLRVLVFESGSSQVVSEPTASTTSFLHSEEGVVLEPTTATSTPEVLPVEPVLFEYIEVTDGCGIHFEEECVNVRSGPGTDYPVVKQLRNNIVLKVGGKVERATSTWYKVVFDEYLRYPERVNTDWYVAADYVTVLYDEGDKTIWDDGHASSSDAEAVTLQHILVDRSEQKLYAYDGDELFLETDISTGLALTPTPRGEFTIFKKTPSRYMQGPLPGLPADQYYDLPGVPWNLYFTHQGAVIHGAYWHNSFGTPYSHGCVNLMPDTARTLYNWAKLGTRVTVQD